MRKRITLYATIFIAGALQSFGQTLDESIKIAAENNPGLKASYTQFEAAMQRVAQVYSLPNPTISLGAFISPIETRVGPQQAKLGLAQMFPWFGTLQAKENMATAQAEAQYQRFINAQNELTFKVKEAWYPLYELHQAVVLQKQNLEILASFKQLSL
ncbi:MAG: cobalt-zinc-cadmium efflux system outer membrane protein, partial [Bacteroidia bacterium]